MNRSIVEVEYPPSVLSSSDFLEEDKGEDKWSLGNPFAHPSSWTSHDWVWNYQSQFYHDPLLFPDFADAKTNKPSVNFELSVDTDIDLWLSHSNVPSRLTGSHSFIIQQKLKNYIYGNAPTK